MTMPKSLAEIWEELTFAEKDQLLTYVKTIRGYREMHMGALPLIAIEPLYKFIDHIGPPVFDTLKVTNPFAGASVLVRLRARYAVADKRKEKANEEMAKATTQGTKAAP